MENNLQPIENNNQRVLTTAQIAEQYETTTDRIKDNFNANKARYTEGKHYYCLTGEVLKQFKNKVGNSDLVKPNAKILYLWTEKGALLHAKSLNTDKAWQAYDVLVDTYFTIKENKLPQMSEIEMIAAIAEHAVKLEKKINELEKRTEEFENMDKKMMSICDTISLDRGKWRKNTHNLLLKIATKFPEKYDNIGAIYKELYHLVEVRGGVNLYARLNHMKQRMREQGIPESTIKQKNMIDVIETDTKLTEIYLAIVKELAVKLGV